MKFLYFIKQPLAPRDLKRYGIDYMLSRGHSVTVMDLSDVIHPNLPNVRTGAGDHPEINHRVIRSWKHFKAEKALIAESDLVFFLIQSYGISRRTYRPLMFLKKSGAPYLIFSPALYHGWEAKSRRQFGVHNVKNFCTRLRRMDPLNSLISRLPPALFNAPKAAFIVQRSRHENWSNSLVGPNTKVIEAHTDDYEIFLEEKIHNPKIKNQAVFLDQFLPFHVDFIEQNSGHLDADAYYDGLCRVFDRIERELGLEIIIAAHPRADYNERPDLFAGRQVIFGKTVKLVAESCLVLAHYSTAVGFAVLFHKPVMLLVNKEVFRSNAYIKYAFDALALELGTPLRYYDEPETMDISNALDVNTVLYDKYADTYLKCPNLAPKSLWENVANAIESAV